MVVNKVECLICHRSFLGNEPVCVDCKGDEE
jgi:hypothetical protein